MQKPQSCKGCPLYTLGTSFSHSEGTGRNGVAIIGEALGHEEALDGLPFRPKAQAGSKLQQCIDLAGYSRSDFLLWNIIACQPPNNKLAYEWYEQSAIGHCTTHFKEVIDKGMQNKKVLLALGNTAFQTLTGTEHSVLDVRGYPFPYRRYGKEVKGAEDVVVIGSLHPSYIKRGNAQLTPLLVEDIQKAVEYAKGKYVSAIEYRKKAN